jgi:uncharacterized protein (TIGR02594 family)
MTFGQRSKGAFYETVERETLGNMGSFGEAIQMWRTGQFGLVEAFKRVGLDILKRETLGNMGIFGELLSAHYKLDGIKDIIDKSAIDPQKKIKSFDDVAQGLRDVDEHAKKIGRALQKNDMLISKNLEKAVKELDTRSEKRFDNLAKKLAKNFTELSTKIKETANLRQAPVFSGGQRTNSVKRVGQPSTAAMSTAEKFGRASTYNKPSGISSALSSLSGLSSAPGAITALAGATGILGTIAGLMTIGSGNSTINDALGITPDMSQEEISRRKKWFNAMRRDPKVGYDGALKKAQEKFKNGNPQNDTIITPKAPNKLKGSSGEDRIQDEGDIKKIEDWNVYSSQHINIEAQKILKLKASSIVLDAKNVEMPDSFWSQVVASVDKLMSDNEDTGESGEGDGQAVTKRRKQKGLSPLQQRMKMGQGLSVPYTSNYGMPSTTHQPSVNPNVPYDGWAIDPSGQPQGAPGVTGGPMPYSSDYNMPSGRQSGRDGSGSRSDPTIDASGVGKLYAPQGQNTDDLSDIDANQLKFLRAIAQSETNWDRKEAYTDKNNAPNDVWDGNRLVKKGNANVRAGMARGMSEEEAKAEYGDYGHFQMNRHDVNEAIKKYGLDPEMAKHLYGGGAGGTSTPQEQTRAMHHYLSKRYPEIYERLKTGDPKAYEDARKAMSGMYFGLRNHWGRDDVQAALGGKVTPGMLGDGSPSLGKSSSMSDLNNAQKYLEGQLAKAPEADKSSIQKQLDQINGLKENLSQQRQQRDLSQSVNGNPEAAAALAESMKGLHEVGDRQVIREYLKNGGKGLDPATQSWCADFINASLAQSGIEGTKGYKSVVANSFQKWGTGVDDASTVRKGDVLVEHRGLGPDKPGGHVAFSTGKTRMTKDGRLQLEMLGGNQSDSVSTKWTDASKLMIRRATTPEFEKQVTDYEKATGKKAFEGGKRSDDFKAWLSNNKTTTQPQQPTAAPNVNKPADQIVPPPQSSDTSKETPAVPPAAPPQNNSTAQQQANEAAAQSGPNPHATDNKTNNNNEEPELKMPPTQHNPDKHKGGPADKSRGENEEDDFSLNI